MTDLTDPLLAHIRDEIVLEGADGLDADTELLVSGIVDSLGVIRIVHWLEDRLGVEIDPGDVVLENFQSVHCMIGYVDRRLAARGSP